MLTVARGGRYGRQVILREVGGRGQQRLLAARVAVAGAGPAATAAVTLLGRAGVGTLDVSAGVGPLPELSPDCRCGASEGPAADVTLGLLELTATDDDAPAHGAPFGLEAARRPVVPGLLARDRILVATLVRRPRMRCSGHALAPAHLRGYPAAATRPARRGGRAVAAAPDGPPPFPRAPRGRGRRERARRGPPRPAAGLLGAPYQPRPPHGARRHRARQPPAGLPGHRLRLQRAGHAVPFLRGGRAPPGRPGGGPGHRRARGRARRLRRGGVRFRLLQHQPL